MVHSALLPDLGIPDMKRTVLRIIFIGQKQPLFSSLFSIFRLHQYLRGPSAFADIVIISCFLYVSRVEEMNSIFISPGTSGIDAVPVKGSVGFQEDPLISPVD